MRHDKEILELIKNLREDCSVFINTVGLYGNQCAQTDRMLEGVLELADKVKLMHDGDFGVKQPVHYGHISDCWRALEACHYIEEVESLFEDFPRWSGSWSWFDDNGSFCVRNDYHDSGTGTDDYEIRELESLSSDCSGEVYWEIVYNEKEYNVEKVLHYGDFDDARSDFLEFSETEDNKYYNYLVLREVTVNEKDGTESREDIQTWGLDEKDKKEVK